MNNFKNLCKPMKIANVTIKNRFCVAPMSPGFTNLPTGEFTSEGLDYYVGRAKGGFGLIFTGAFSSDMEVDPENNLSPNPLKSPEAFRKTGLEFNNRINRYDCHAFGQITLGVGRNYPGFFAPSELPVFENSDILSPALTVEQIKTKIDYCAKVAKLMKDSGFSGVEVHALHWGYLLDQFAMEITNKRTDKYGGSLENRLRITKETLDAIKEKCGENFPVTIRLGMKSYIESLEQASLNGKIEAGRTLEEAVQIAKMLEDYGYDALSVDTGVYESFYYACPPMYVERGFAVDLAAEVKKAVTIPILLGGRMGEPVMAEKAIEEGKIDSIVLGRPSLADPDFPRKVEMGQPEKIRPCIACNQGCIYRLLEMGLDSFCAVNPKLKNENNYVKNKADIQKKVVIIGGGIAGMESARILSMRGHDVSLYEKTDQFGGHLIPGGAHEFKVEINELNQWYQQEIKDLNVDIYMNKEMDAEEIKALNPDAVVLAVGSKPIIPDISGMDSSKAVSCIDALNGTKQVGDKVVVVGGGLVGCEIALEYIQKGKDVTIVEALDSILSAGETVPKPNKTMLQDIFKEYKTKIKTNCLLSGINEEGAVIVSNGGDKKETIEADSVVIAVGFKPLSSMAEQLQGSGIEIYEVGDGRQVGNIMTSVWDAYEIANMI